MKAPRNIKPNEVVPYTLREESESPAVVRKHYGKWSKGRQANIDRLMFAHF